MSDGDVPGQSTSSLVVRLQGRQPEAWQSFVRVYGARNALLGVLALTFIAGGMLQPLTLLFAFATVLPVLDAIVISSSVGPGPVLVRHAVILLVLAATSVALRRLHAVRRQNAPP